MCKKDATNLQNALLKRNWKSKKKNQLGEIHTPTIFDMLFSKIASIFNAVLILYSNFIKISKQNPEKAGKNAFSTKIAIFSVKIPKTKNCNNQKKSRQHKMQRKIYIQR